MSPLIELPAHVLKAARPAGSTFVDSRKLDNGGPDRVLRKIKPRPETAVLTKANAKASFVTCMGVPPRRIISLKKGPMVCGNRCVDRLDRQGGFVNRKTDPDKPGPCKAKVRL